MNLIKIFLLMVFLIPAYGMDKIVINKYKLFTDEIVCDAVVTSSDRTIQENERVGGKANSYHLKGEALDIAFPNCLTSTEDLGKIAQRFFSGVIVYTRHIHVDIRDIPYFGKGWY